MSKTTQDLLDKAKSLNDERLTDAIEALEFLGEEATANHQEYKDLKYLVENGENAVLAVDANTTDKEVSEAEAQAEEKIASQNNIPEKDVSLEPNSLSAMPVDPVRTRRPQGLKYAGIKMIGNMFYSRKDNYTVGFATADECAEHFNQ